MREKSFDPALLDRLRPNERKGSKPRCHFLTHGTPADVASRLTSLIEPWGTVSEDDSWMPLGFDKTGEAQLHRDVKLIRRAHDRDVLKNWWLADPRPTSRTPTWDIASTCLIGVRPGILLIEAKAHRRELSNEQIGKRLRPDGSEENHNRIASAIAEANSGLGAGWKLSRDHHYQMSNRFAWSWKLCTLGYSVALVYLGFLRADEMRKERQEPFEEGGDWVEAVKRHSATLFPAGVWSQSMVVRGSTLVPIIASRYVPLSEE